MRTWSPSELRSFLEGVAHEPLYPVFLVAATTGMRRGEVLGLRWGDVDLDAGRAAIQQTVVCVGHQVCISRPKTAKGRRSVPLDPFTVGVLRALHQAQTTHALDGSDLVFRDDQVSPSTRSQSPACTSAGSRRAACPGSGSTT
ncbi:hypothetical protein BH20ACT21_BH20ACT21_12700 [soil metagenome]